MNLHHSIARENPEIRELLGTYDAELAAFAYEVVGTAGQDADIAIPNAEGARITVPAGDITVGAIYTLMPFGNTLAVLDLSGTRINATLEDALSNIFDDGNSDGSFPYTAGASLYSGGREMMTSAKG